MGSSSSKASGGGGTSDERTYLLPEDREKDRFIPSSQQNVSVQYDPSVDKVNKY